MADDTSGTADLGGARDAVQQRIADIEAELASVEALEAERDRLVEALRLMGASTSERRTSRSKTPPRRTSTRATGAQGRRSGGTGSSGRRSNRDGVLSYLAEHPDAQAGAIVEHLGASRGVVYNLLARLVDQELIVRQAGPAGRARYRLRSPVSQS